MTHLTLIDTFFEQTTGPGKEHVYLRARPKRGEPFRNVTFAEFGERVKHTAVGFASLGVQRGDRIAIVSESRPEWLIGEFVALSLGAIWVPMFPTLTPQQIEYIVQDCAAKVLIVSNDLQYGKALKFYSHCPSLEAIVLLNRETRHAQPPNIRFLHFDDLSNVKEVEWNFEFEARKAVEDDTVVIIYTSGTTGNPKGVMLSHRNIRANVEGALAAIPSLTENDSALSFLPMCHTFEHIAMQFFLFRGMSVAFAESAETVADDLLEIRPTVMTGVPRFFERIYGRIMRMREKLPTTRRAIFDWALAVGKKNGRRFEGERVPLIPKLLLPIADALVLKKIRERTGGRIRFFVSGAAALPAEVGRAFAAFGLPILEGYGLTEAAPVLAVNHLEKMKWGSVGPKLYNVELKIADDGEILACGPNVMQGYFRNPEAAREMIDAEGWLHTGDVGQFDSDGYLKITDRKKHLFVSSGGKNIAPAPIEALLTKSPWIEQVMLIGDKRQFCTALIVPDLEALKDTGIVSEEDIRAAIWKDIEQRQSAIASYERVRRFTVLTEPFTVENGMMTPTLKVRRKAVEERYGELIEAMYRIKATEPA